METTTIILLLFMQIVCMGIATQILIQEKLSNKKIRVVLFFVFNVFAIPIVLYFMGIKLGEFIFKEDSN